PSTVRSASFVLLHGVPATISLEQVRAAILAVEGVQSLHELHIWQLSESKNIASVPVLAAREHDFMPIAPQIRRALHDQGIHPCTIQPEYYGTRGLLNSCAKALGANGNGTGNRERRRGGRGHLDLVSRFLSFPFPFIFSSLFLPLPPSFLFSLG
ncbi:hypothetical protein C8F04DRAFT_968766, partial [Mycena alexandri]